MAEWQTRWLQVPVSARTWGFKSPLAHNMTSHIAHDAEISDSAQIGDRSQVWNLTQVRDGVKIGSSCVIGRSVYIGPGVRIGNNCKIQNNALIYDPAVLDDGVFIGPGVILTNDRVPRAVTPDGDLKSAADWDPVECESELEHRSAQVRCASPRSPSGLGRWLPPAARLFGTCPITR